MANEKKARFISHTSVCGKGKEIAKKLDEGTSKKILKVYGLAVSCKQREGKFGEQAEFRGQFEAVNLLDGVTFNANKLYLPTEPSAELETSIAADKEGKGVKFAYEISITADDSERGYFYDFESLMKPVTSDALVEMRKLAGSKPVEKAEGRPVAKK